MSSTQEAASLVEIWTSLKNYIPQKERLQAAEHFLSTIDQNALCDLEQNALELFGICETLDRALKEYVPEDEYEELEHEDW
jgi:hypothetical protein